MFQVLQQLKTFSFQFHQLSLFHFKQPKDGGQSMYPREPFVPQLPICEWMIDDMKFKLNDYVVIKLDIEGGEYPIMQHIWDYHNDECISLIDEMFIEWHPWGQDPWIDGQHHHYLERAHSWNDQFQAKGIKMHMWH